MSEEKLSATIVTQEDQDSACLLILLIYTKLEDEILDWPRVLVSFSNTKNENIQLLGSKPEFVHTSNMQKK